METHTCTAMDSLFNGASAFNADIKTSTTSTNKWKVEAVNTFSNMFKDASSFNQNIANWAMKDTVDNNGLATMFQGATNFQLNLCDWNVHLDASANAVTNMFASTKCPNANGEYENTDTNVAAGAKSCCTCDAVDANTPGCA